MYWWRISSPDWSFGWNFIFYMKDLFHVLVPFYPISPLHCSWLLQFIWHARKKSPNCAVKTYDFQAISCDITISHIILIVKLTMYFPNWVLSSQYTKITEYTWPFEFYTMLVNILCWFNIVDWWTFWTIQHWKELRN